MRRPVKALRTKSLIICASLLISVFLVEIVCAYTLGEDFSFRAATQAKGNAKTDGSDEGDQTGETEDRVQLYTEKGITLDRHSVNGLINPKEKTDGKASSDTMKYKINQYPEFKDGEAEGTVLIENYTNNQYFMKVRIDLEDGKTVYESGLIAPGTHIEKAPLDIALDKGEYKASATIEAYQLDDEQEFYSNLPNKQEITIRVLS